MPKDDDDYGLLLAAGLLAVGVGLFAAAAAKDNNEAKRAAFTGALRTALNERGVALVGATLGRDAANQLFWDVTVQNYMAQLWTQRVSLSPGLDAYSPATRELIVAQLVGQAA